MRTCLPRAKKHPDRVHESSVAIVDAELFGSRETDYLIDDDKELMCQTKFQGIPLPAHRIACRFLPELGGQREFTPSIIFCDGASWAGPLTA